jgi:hypothetical protein
VRPRGAQKPVGFVNSVVADFQGNPESLASGISAASLIAADSGERFQRVRERLPVIAHCPLGGHDGKALPLPSLLRFSAEQMPIPSTAKPFGRVLFCPWGAQTRSSTESARLQRDRIYASHAGDLSAKNRELVSEHDDLELLELMRTQTQRRHREDAPKQQIHQRHEQGRDSLLQDADGPTLRSRSHLRRVLERPDGFTHPTPMRSAGGSKVGQRLSENRGGEHRA